MNVWRTKGGCLREGRRVSGGDRKKVGKISTGGGRKKSTMRTTQMRNKPRLGLLKDGTAPRKRGGVP